jgi:DNA-binding CsgD family transcriptional regulator
MYARNMATKRRRRAPAAPRDRVDEIAALIVEGLTDREIGDRLGINPRTVKYHVGRLCLAYGVARKRELIPILHKAAAS